MNRFDHIVFIYNPNSTGDAPSMAKRLQQALTDTGVSSALAPTDRAGHAKDIAYDIATEYSRPLIVSVSGDGGYHEVVNGAMAAKENDASRRPVVAVAGAGNANDHRRVIRQRPFMEAFADGSPRTIDLLLLETDNTQSIRTYAHSYIGLGITPEVAVELNKHQLNFFKELWIAWKAFVRYKPFTIIHDGKDLLLDSLIFANINEMAKIIKLNHKRAIHDNMFEVVAFQHKTRLHLLTTLITAVVVGLKNQPSYERYSFKTTTDHHVQMDGELIELSAGAEVVVRCIPDAIESLY